MFTTIRKHQTWLWAFIIAAVIVSFVIYFAPTTGRGDRSGMRMSDFGSIHGRPITRKEYSQALLESELGCLMRYGVWPGTLEARQTGFSIEREIRNRLVLLDSVRALNIQPGESAVAAWIMENFSATNQLGSAKMRYQSFLRDIQRRYRVSETDFHRFIEHEIAVGHLANLVGVGGKLVTPRTAAELFRQSHEKIDAEVVFFTSSNRLLSVEMDPAAIAQYFTNRQSVYRVPERVQVQYVRFPLTNYFGEADAVLAKNTNLAAEIDRAYQGSNPSSFTDTNGQVLPPDAAKAKLRQTVRDRQALIEAHKAAASFASELEKMKPVAAENLSKLAASNRLAIAVTEPFAESEGPRDLRVRPNFVDTAFRLTAEEPLAISPIRAEDAVYVIALQRRIQSELPLFENIRAQVEQDFRRDQAMRLAREAGTNFVTKATNDMARGKSFATVCAEANVTATKLPVFSAASGPIPDWDRRIDLSQAKAATSGVDAGKLSRLVLTRDGAFALYVSARTPVLDLDLKKELPEFLATMRQSEQYRTFNDWFQRQIEVTRIATYMGREQTE